MFNANKCARKKSDSRAANARGCGECCYRFTAKAERREFFRIKYSRLSLTVEILKSLEGEKPYFIVIFKATMKTQK